MNIRNYKISYQIYNFFRKEQLKHNISFYKKYGLKKRYFSSISSEDFKDIESPLNIHDSKDSYIKMPKNPLFNKIDKKTKTSLLSWSKNGYTIINNFFDEDVVDLINNKIEYLLNDEKVEFSYGNKIMSAFHYSEFLERVGYDEKLIRILTLIMGKEVELFQSINFIYGS